MNSLNQLMNFSAVARHGGFTRAAKELGLAPSSVAKSVARLESEYGARLFHRTTRSVVLTEEGRDLHLRSAALLDEIASLTKPKSENQALEGIVRIAAPIGYGTQVVLPRIAQLQQRYPKLELDLRLSDERINFVEDGLDAAIRFGKLDDSSLVSHRIDDQPLVLCASSQYLNRYGMVTSIDDLDKHKMVSFRVPTTGRNRPFVFRNEASEKTITLPSYCCIDSGGGVVTAAILGMGIAQVPQFLAVDALARGQLVELLPETRPAPLSVNLLLPGGVRAPRIRALVECLCTSQRTV